MPKLKPRERLAALLVRQNNYCHWCKCRIWQHLPESHKFRATLDHVVPISAGGAKGWSNIVAACFACNQRKAAKPAELVFLPKPLARTKHAKMAAALLRRSADAWRRIA